MRIVRKSFNLPNNIKRNIKEYYDKRNSILIIRNTGGVGDILMSLMIFEDIKKMMPEAHITYALPESYHELVIGHPHIDQILDVRKIQPEDYVVSYNISSACGRYEESVAPISDKHRSDIWANHCGYDLTEHNMHINMTDEIKNFGENVINKYREENKPIVLFCPISAMESKNLGIGQMNGVVDALKDECTLVGLHKTKINDLKVPTIHGITLSQWLGVINAADYIITVDSSHFHAGGGLNKPMVAIFSWADGKTYGKWYKKYILVQRHRDNGNWNCGPCYVWPLCPLSNAGRKPCITEITSEEIAVAAREMIQKWDWK